MADAVQVHKRLSPAQPALPVKRDRAVRDR